MRCHIFVLVLMFFLSILPAFSQYEKYRVREIGEDDGLINPKVLSICADSYGYIWMGTDDGLTRFDGLNFTDYNSKETGLPSVRMVSHLFLDTNGILWCVTDNRFISYYSYEKDRFSLAATLPGNLKVTDFLVDNTLNIWISTTNGLYVLKRQVEGAYSISVFNRREVLFTDQWINKIYRQSDDLFWICAVDGLFRFRISDRDTLVSRYYHDRNNDTILTPNNIYSMTIDRNGNLWLAGWGLSKQYPSEVAADTGQHLIEKHQIPLSKLLYKDSDLRNWGGQDFMKILMSVTYDSEDALFIKNLFGLYKYNIQSGEWLVLISAPDIQFNASANKGNMFTLFYNRSDRMLWASINNGIVIINTSKAEFETSREKFLSKSVPDIVLYVYEDRNKRKYAIHFESFEELNRLENFDWVFYSAAEIDTLFVKPPFKYVTTIESGKTFCWFASWYFGVLKYQQKNDTLILSRLYTEKDGLPDDVFIDIIPDKKGRLWIATYQNLTCLDPVNEIFYNFNDFRNIRNNRLFAAGYLDEKGYLHLPTLDGAVIVKPDELLNSYLPPKVIISRVNNAGTAIRCGENTPVEPAVTKFSSIRVPYRNNDISIELGNLNFFDPNSCIFMYKMDGIDKEWKNNRENRNISYGSLRPGKYSFHAVAVRKDGRTESAEAGFDLIITPAFYQRTFFYPLIIILILIILFTIVKIREKNLRARAADLENEVREKTAQIIEHTAQMEKMKNRFYTNISHEFRTPLTLINSSAREIEKDPRGENIHKFTGTIFKSSGRLLRLVNELLDLSKLEAGKLDLKVAEEDLASVVRFVYQNYISDAERRGIKYSFRSDPDTIICWFDRDLIQKITHNLISNALKFTPAGKQVSVEVNLYQNGDGKTTVPEIPGPQAAIIVKDTGKGIKTEHLSKIFDRFYQADSSSTREYEGTGIGLAIVHEMTVRHYGKVIAESRDGEGSEFTVIIPAAKSAYKESELRNDTTELKDDPFPVLLSSGEKKHKRIFQAGHSGKQAVLIVEDNDDLREFMAEGLGKRFNVAEAVNGKEGLEKAVALMPDIIISDIMMPEVNGVDLCSQVKNNNMTCHIPVILLTAKADTESRLEGLRTGADDYLTKPFNEEELTVRIDNLLLLRQKLREKFLSSSFSVITGIRTGCSDETMMKELLNAIETNMGKSSYTLDDLAMELGLGKRSLQRKIKSLTGLNPVDFIKMVKIKLAAAMIAGRNASVSEAAYATGFSSLSHFTRSFRKITGVNPSEYRQSIS